MTLFQEGNTVSNNKLIFPVALSLGLGMICMDMQWKFKQSFFYSFITILPSESGATLHYSTILP
jgi:hypothetical protein